MMTCWTTPVPPALNRITPEYQHLQVGDWMPMAKKDHRHDRVQGDGVRDQSVATGQYMARKLIRLDRGRMEQSGTVWCPPRR